MSNPSEEDEALILVLSKGKRQGDLQSLQELKEKAGDEEAFRRICETTENLEGCKPLHYAAEHGSNDICKFLIEEVKVRVDVQTGIGETPLILAVQEGYVHTVKYLIEQGANVSHTDCKDRTPLHYAVKRGNEEMMDLLLSKGSDIEAKAVKGTPLQVAASAGKLSSVQFLLSRGAKPNPVSPLAVSPIVSTIISNAPDCFELLLKDKCDPNARSFGKSPLAHAAAEGRASFIEPLLMAGAKPDSVSTALMKPIEFAVFSGNRKAVNVLFPLTSPVPTFSDWSLSGVLDSIDSVEAKEKMQQKKDFYFQLAISRGKEAFNRKDYSNAITWFSEAIYTDRTHFGSLSYRSLCWAKLNEWKFALHDAQACVRLKPELAVAHYRQGEAWRQLKRYPLAGKALGKAWDLEPGDKNIKKAYMEAVSSGFREMINHYPVETVETLSEMLKHACKLFGVDSTNKEIQKQILEVVFSRLVAFMEKQISDCRL